MENATKALLIAAGVLIGIIMNPETVLNKSIADILKKEIERKLTVLFNSPISDVFSFLSFDPLLSFN